MISGEIPHPNGKVAVDYKLEKGKWKINVDLPKATTGTLIWKTKQYLLKAGNNSLII